MTTPLIKAWLFIKTLLEHLKLSISSVQFYKRVFISYNGYGIKYIFTLSIISSFICSIILISYANKITNYLDNNETSIHAEYIDQIIRQLPILDYNGRTISLQETTPLFLRDLENTKILAIDPENKLNSSDKVKTPIILGKDTIIINVNGSQENLRKTVPIKYIQIFGTHPQSLTQEVIKSNLALISKKTPSLLIYLIFPLLTGLIFINTILDKVFMTLMVFLITRISKIKTNFQSCIRIVLFTNGLYALLYLPLTFLVLGSGGSSNIAYIISLILPFLQICANFLMILGILQSTGKAKVFRL